MGVDTYYEIARRSIAINKHEETTLLWEDNSPLAVRSDKGVYFYEFSYDIHCTGKAMDFLESTVTSPKSTPAKSLFTNAYLKTERPNIETTEMILDPALWPHNDQLIEEMANVRSMKWSPKGFIGNYDTALAILNDVGGIEFFILRRSVWTSIFDFSPVLQQYFADHMKPATNFEMLKQAAYTVEPSAIFWAPFIEESNSYFVTAQKNGKILFWHLKCKETDIQAQVVGSVQCDIAEIVSMIWIPKTTEQFLLICSDILGQIVALECNKECGQITFLQSHTLWPHKDKMIAKHLQYTILNDKIVLVCNKYRHLLVQMFDKNMKKLSEYLNNVNDYRITDICKTMDEIYLSTINTRLFKVNMKTEGDRIIVSLDKIEIKDMFPTHELFGISFSPNNMICVLGLIDTKTNNKKKAANIDIAFLISDNKIHSIIPTLVNNPSQKLTYMWDCIEVLRCRTMKTCQMPKLDYNNLYVEGDTNVYKLKLYLIFVILFNNLRKQFKLVDQEPAELSEDTVREKILAQRASEVIRSLNDKYHNKGMLSKFEMESLSGARTFIAYVNKKNKLPVRPISNDPVDISFQCDYVCQCCDEILSGFTCKYNHLNMFCSLTFTLIKDFDYLACRACNSTAQVELYVDKPMCVYCDLYLNMIAI